MNTMEDENQVLLPDNSSRSKNHERRDISSLKSDLNKLLGRKPDKRKSKYILFDQDSHQFSEIFVANMSKSFH
jgi:hypothetical protein